MDLSRHGIVTKRRLECVRGFENRVYPRSSWDGGRSGHGVQKRQRVPEGETHAHPSGLGRSPEASALASQSAYSREPSQPPQRPRRHG